MNQEKIGRFIKTLRMKKDMTQSDLANKIGVTDRAISKWENGRGSPDISLLIPLSEALNVSVLELLSGEKVEDENSVVINIIKHKNKKIKVWKILFSSLINIIMLFMVITSTFGFIIPAIYENSNNKGITRIISDSMKPTLNPNEYIVYNKINIDKVKKDDIVLFYYMNEEDILVNGFVAHRVIEVKKDNNGNINLLTKGDNNIEEDKQYVTIKNFIGVYKHKTSKLTSFFLEQNIKDYIIFLIICTLGIISILCFDIIELKKYFNNK